ncbi:hypothetical protein PR003_g30690 [Phytophthora rubi]|uniref:SGNH hydrolase-type esterase domain-containing protein n=1 Tax=Phytophthora rubi TaxID=129364 RepID=A0A6A4BAI5_9STRA|nr:hypothetical protein PR001_g29636 [Phytophthora rubi]KAE9270868.1 hypothetical protein PR003_g30690 [Phytophthora rubi]
MALSVRLVRAVLAVAAIASCASWSANGQETTTTTVYTDPQPRRMGVLITGDSITEQADDPTVDGWVTLFQYQYQQGADIIVRGMSGYNSRWFLKYVMPTLEKELKDGVYIPSIITVWLGTNDAVLTNGSNADMHVPLKDYTANMIKIVTKFQAAAPDAKIIMITPPHVDDAVRAKEAKEHSKGVVDRSDTRSGRYAQACVEVATMTGVSVLDLYKLFHAMPLATRNKHLQDGLHFSPSGHKIINDELQNLIRSKFPEEGKKLDVYQFPFVAKWREEDPYVPVNNTSA